MNRRLTITGESHYRGLRINANSDKGNYCYTELLDRYFTHLMDMITKHCKVMQVRFDLRYPQDGSVIPHPSHYSDFQYNFNRYLERKNKGKKNSIDARFIAVEEKHKSHHPHYHVNLLVNGNARQKYYPLVQKAVHFWGYALGVDARGLVDFCHDAAENGIMYIRNHDDALENLHRIFKQGSYIAKTRSKDELPKGSWLARGTRLPKDFYMRDDFMEYLPAYNKSYNDGHMDDVYTHEHNEYGEHDTSFCTTPDLPNRWVDNHDDGFSVLAPPLDADDDDY